MAALPMWMYFMEEALKNKPDRPFLAPAGIVRIKIDSQTGLAAGDGQTGTLDEFFTAETVPTTQKTGLRTPKVDQQSLKDKDEAIENQDLPPPELLF
jgi:penicillin-binding protein 1A